MKKVYLVTFSTSSSDSANSAPKVVTFVADSVFSVCTHLLHECDDSPMSIQEVASEVIVL